MTGGSADSTGRITTNYCPNCEEMARRVEQLELALKVERGATARFVPTDNPDFNRIQTELVERVNSEKARAESAEAELAALKARRCDGCDSSEDGGGHYCLLLSLLTGPDFCCNRWEARA